MLRTSPSLVAEFQGNRDLAHASVDGLASLPTPLEPIRRLAAYLRGPRLWVKREDATGLGFGGNKLRKLGYILHDAIASKADVLVSGGGVQSNSQRQVAAAAAKLGMECHLAVYQDRLAPPTPEYGISGNALLNRLFGAHLHDVPWKGNRNAAIEELGSRLREERRRPYFVPYGVSNPLGAIAYASTIVEIAEQSRALGICPGAIVRCTGSAGTQAANIASNLPHEVHCKVTQLSFETPVGRMICALLTLVGNLPKGFYCLCHLPLRLVVPSWGVCGMRKYNSGRIRTGLIPVCPDGDR